MKLKMIPQKTKYGKYRKGEWKKNAIVPLEKFSEGIYAIIWEGVDMDNGTILKGFKIVMNCCLYKEMENFENELRKSKILLTQIKTQKQK